MADDKKKFSKQQTKLLLPVIKKFNGIAKGLINILSKKIEEKEQRLNTIRVLVQDVKIPTQNHQFNIQAVDLKNTIVKQKGSYAINQMMDWEKELRNRNKGIIL